ncbi:MAG: rod shape-determining protein MreC [Anaerolineae bacterium]
MTRERLRNLVPIFLILLVLVGITLHRLGLLEPVIGVLLKISVPVQKGVTSVVTQFTELAQTVQDLRELRQRNQELETQNARLLLENVRLKEVEHEVILLRELLNFYQEHPSWEIRGAHVTGRVIARDPSNLRRSITLDVGTEAGIARNMPVITERGLVGRILEVGEGWSKVLLITDVSSSVNALTQSSRASGLVQGRADGSLIMQAIPQGDTVSVGDTVFTSGLGGNFPRQILIGQITAVERKDSALYQTAVLQPTVDFDHLEVVLVVTGFKPVEEATPTD